MIVRVMGGPHDGEKHDVRGAQMPPVTLDLPLGHASLAWKQGGFWGTKLRAPHTYVRYWIQYVGQDGLPVYAVEPARDRMRVLFLTGSESLLLPGGTDQLKWYPRARS